MLLFTPGPTTIPERVIKAMTNCSSLHHRTAEFEHVFAKCQQSFQELFELTEPPLFLACSGTGGLEAALRAVCQKGGKVGFVNGGKFGERWGRIANVIGLQSVELYCPWGESVSDFEFRAFLKLHPDLRVICFQHLETSTGVLHPVEKLSAICREESPNTLIVVDAISSFAASKLDTSTTDIVVGGSQKALMLPPGLAFLILSKRAWQVAESTPQTSFYFNLLTERKAQQKANSAWTPPISLFLGLAEVLQMLSEEGLENVYKRHLENSKVCRNGLRELGFELLAEAHPAGGVTPAQPPSGVDAAALPARIVQACNKRIAGAQDDWKGKVIRIGHMGIIGPEDVKDLIRDIKNVILSS